MNKKIMLLATMGFIIVLFSMPRITVAQNLNQSLEKPKNLEEALTSQLKKKLKQGAYFLLGIETRLKNSTEELDLLRSNVKSLKEKLKESQTQIGNLTSQLANLDHLIKENEEKIRAGNLQIAAYQNAIEITKTDIRERENLLRKQMQGLNQALTAFYLQNNTFFSVENGAPRLLAFLSEEKDIGNILKENQELDYFRRATQDLAQGIIQNQWELDEKREQLKEKKEKQNKLQTLLMREKRTLLATQQSRQRLLTETQGRQLIYKSLLDISKKEEEQVQVQIERLKENYAFFETKLAELKNNPRGMVFKMQDEDKEENFRILRGSETLAWPVNPGLGLSATFHDNAYQAALGVIHNAIDIRLAQGSKVKAAADGVVTKVADNGFAYSYIIIAHAENLLTLYGHMSDILVTEGEIVRQGQTIGLSGGIPGTKGAGWLTTGAHLHFEVFKNWQHVDPLEYLPLEYVPVASLPEKYLKKLIGEEEKIKRN